MQMMLMCLTSSKIILMEQSIFILSGYKILKFLGQNCQKLHSSLGLTYETFNIIFIHLIKSLTVPTTSGMISVFRPRTSWLIQ